MCTPRRAHQLLGSVAVRLQLELDYDPVAAEAPLGVRRKMVGPSWIDGQSFQRTLSGGEVRLIELARTVRVGGAWELHLYGVSLREETRGANPDVGAAAGWFKGLLEEAGQAAQKPPDPRDLAFEMFNLSYAQSDRVLGLLKALGYSTIEYKAAAAQQSTWEKVFETVAGSGRELPLVVKLLDSDKTSLLEPVPEELELRELQNRMRERAQGGDIKNSTVPEIGGQFLHQTTTGEPLQRLLIVHDPADPEPVARLLKLLKEQVDVPARQIVIEALVIEVNTDRTSDLGLSFSFGDGQLSGSFDRDDIGRQQAFNLSFNDLAHLDDFRVALNALVVEGAAQILSNPSVLVLDGRQARIQVGQQLPTVSSAATVGVVSQSVEYFPVGIVLNLRPRLNSDANEVTMQVETIVSAVTSSGTSVRGGGEEVFFAPIIDNRRVQTMVRVADNTPFIIGGLIATEEREEVSRVPVLSKIPFLGNLFKRKSRDNVRSEVIVVITPHVVPLEDRSFGYVIPKESDRFDSFGRQLFRDSYRIRQKEVFDLQFVRESPVLASARRRLDQTAAFAPELLALPEAVAVRDGAIPGEEILVRRMLWETVRSTGVAVNVQPERIILFEREGDGLALRFLRDLLARRTAGSEDLVVSFPDLAISDTAPRLVPAEVGYAPAGSLTAPAVEQADRVPTIVLPTVAGRNSDPLELLQGVLVLKRVLDFNGSLPLRIDQFYVGREIVYPTPEELLSSFHVVDENAARLFFEVQNYYPAFEYKFNRTLRELDQLLERFSAKR